MSTFQHVPDDRIDVALAEFVRVLEPGASVIIGLWGGRDEVIDRAWAKSPVQLPRHFTLRTHEHIETLISRHFLDESHEVVSAGPSDWDYHVVRARTPT